MASEKTQQAKKVTERSTKQDIWGAYNALAERIEKKSIEPTGEVKNEEILLEKLGGLKKEIAREIELISEKSAESLSELASVRDIVAREKKRMFNIFSEQRQALEEEIKNVRLLWKREELEKKGEENEEARQEELVRRREVDEYNYSTERKRKEGSDKFENELAKRKEEIEDEKTKMVGRKSEISEMEKKIEVFPTQIEKAVKEARNILLAELSGSHKNHVREMELIFQGKESLLDLQIKNFQSLVESQVKEIESLKKQLSEANDRLKEMAVSAVSSRSDARKRETEE